MIHYALLIAERYNCNGREVAEMIAARLPEESRPDRKRGKTLWDDFVESVMAEGIEKGGREALRTTAIKLIKLGLRDLDIAESTGLSIQEVQELKKPDCR
jgi:predicted transposase/invertase (TIGR01784 family)